MRNLLSLIEAVAQGQAWFADLLWSRIFFSAYSLGWDSETAGRAWQCATEDRWWLIWLSPAQLWTWGLSRRYTKGNSVQLGSAAKRARGAEKQTPELLKTLASQRPAQPLRHSGVCAGLLSWVGTAPGAWGQSQHVVAPSIGVKLPYLTESNKETGGSTKGVCHGCVLLPQQSTSSFSRPIWLFTRADSIEVHYRTAWQNWQAAEQGFQIMKSYTPCTSARPHDLGKNTHQSLWGINF